MTPSANSLHSTTDGEDARSPKKRPRPVLSCFECRRKKLKCDRLLPCLQCKKSGRTARCAFAAPEDSPELGEDNHSLGAIKKARVGHLQRQEQERELETGDAIARVENGINAHTTTGVVADVEDLKARVAKLERVLSKTFHPESPDLEDAGDQIAPQPDVLRDPVSLAGDRQRSNLGMMITKGNRSRYHAPDQSISMLFRFKEALRFVQCLFKEPPIAVVMKEVKSARKLQAKYQLVVKPPLDNPSSIYATMRDTLPPRQVCERLTSVYFTRSESLLRILHRPTFLRDCEVFWNREQGLEHVSHSFVDDAVLPQLVAVMLVASAFGDTGRMTAEILSTEILYDALKSWVNVLNAKRRLQLSTLQTQCLLLLARQMHPSQAELLENDSATLVRSAMKMGLHRDPCEFPNISLFEGELRRRLWMTVVELDMQISYLSGGRPIVRDGDFNTNPAAMLDDNEIFEGFSDPALLHTLKTPNNLRSADVDAHLYAVLGYSIQHRLKAFDFANALRFVTADEVLEQGHKLEAVRDSLRDKLKDFNVSRTSPWKYSEGEVLNYFLVYVYTLRPLLSIYRRHGLWGHESSAIRMMEAICVESSLEILSFLDVLKSSQSGMGHGSDSLNLFLILCKADVMQAALTLCLAAEMMDEARPARLSYKCIDGEKTWSRVDLIDRVNTAVHSLLARKHEPIHDIRDPLCLVVITQYLLHMDQPRVKDARMRVGACNLISSYLESLRQSTAKSNFSSGFTFELGSTSPLVEDSLVPKPNGSARLGDLNIGEDMNFGSSDFNMDSFLDFGFSDDWDWQQEWL